MNELMHMLESALNAYEGGRAMDMARSAEWLAVRDHCASLTSRLLVNGQTALANRVDREYQHLREALKVAAKSPDGRRLIEVGEKVGTK